MASSPHFALQYITEAAICSVRERPEGIINNKEYGYLEKSNMSTGNIGKRVYTLFIVQRRLGKVKGNGGAC